MLKLIFSGMCLFVGSSIAAADPQPEIIPVLLDFNIEKCDPYECKYEESPQQVNITLDMCGKLGDINLCMGQWLASRKLGNLEFNAKIQIIKLFDPKDAHYTLGATLDPDTSSETVLIMDPGSQGKTIHLSGLLGVKRQIESFSYRPQLGIGPVDKKMTLYQEKYRAMKELFSMRIDEGTN